ncbi:hypothetical protein KCP74_17745 [Salmonella enterica subsp. enterica]|nr:hypothetical protein KCP74_17745 [Salmonella enterica subsp. enterica]
MTFAYRESIAFVTFSQHSHSQKISRKRQRKIRWRMNSLSPKWDNSTDGFHPDASAFSGR